MKTKPLTFLLALTFLFLFSGSSVVFGDDFGDGIAAYVIKDYETAYKLWLPLAEQGDAGAQYLLGMMYDLGQGVLQDYKEAVKNGIVFLQKKELLKHNTTWEISI